MRKCDERQSPAYYRSAQGRGCGMRDGLVIHTREEDEDIKDDDDLDDDDDDDFDDDDDEDDDDLDDDEEEADDE